MNSFIWRILFYAVLCYPMLCYAIHVVLLYRMCCYNDDMKWRTVTSINMSSSSSSLDEKINTIDKEIEELKKDPNLAHDGQKKKQLEVLQDTYAELIKYRNLLLQQQQGGQITLTS